MKDWKSISMRFNRERNDVQPFSGVYPTRWKIFAEYSFDRRAMKSDRKFFYQGKPNGKIAAIVHDILGRGMIGHVVAGEYDRGGALAFTDLYVPRGVCTVTDWTRGFRFYYPWLTGNTVFITTWMNLPMHRLPITYQGKRCLIYSRNTAENIEDSSWRTHRAWLNDANIQLGKPQSTLTK